MAAFPRAQNWKAQVNKQFSRFSRFSQQNSPELSNEMTWRCYITLMGAQSLSLGGAPVGSHSSMLACFLIVADYWAIWFLMEIQRQHTETIWWFPRMGVTQVTMVVSILNHGVMTWMILGCPYEFGTLHICFRQTLGFPPSMDCFFFGPPYFMGNPWKIHGLSNS
jgi:hypothetical protein